MKKSMVAKRANNAHTLDEKAARIYYFETCHSRGWRIFQS
jgi:hypothetical protein